MHRDPETLQQRKQMFGRETRNYLLDEDKINRYRIYYSGLEETVFREETTSANRKAEALISKLNRIDELFMNEDEEGIIEIMRAAEADQEISHLSRLRIIGECQSALLELHL